MKTSELVQVNQLLDESAKLLGEATYGTGAMSDDPLAGGGNTNQDDDDPAMTNPDAGDAGGYAGDDDHADYDKPEVATDHAKNVVSNLQKNMDSARSMIEKNVSEAVDRMVMSAYTKERNKLIKEYNKMSFREMGQFSDQIEQLASSMAENIDLKEMIYSAIGKLLKHDPQNQRLAMSYQSLNDFVAESTGVMDHPAEMLATEMVGRSMQACQNVIDAMTPIQRARVDLDAYSRKLNESMHQGLSAFQRQAIEDFRQDVMSLVSQLEDIEKKTRLVAEMSERLPERHERIRRLF